MTKRRLTPTRWLPNDNFCIKSECINPVYRVVADICVRVNILFKPNRILDQEPSCAGITVFLDRATVEDEDYRSIVMSVTDSFTPPYITSGISKSQIRLFLMARL